MCGASAGRFEDACQVSAVSEQLRGFQPRVEAAAAQHTPLTDSQAAHGAEDGHVLDHLRRHPASSRPCVLRGTAVSCAATPLGCFADANELLFRRSFMQPFADQDRPVGCAHTHMLLERMQAHMQHVLQHANPGSAGTHGDDQLRTVL